MMFRSNKLVLALGISLSLGLAACSTDNGPTSTSTDNSSQITRNGDVIPGRYIVVLHDAAVANKGESLQALTHDARLERVSERASDLAASFKFDRANVESVWGTAIRGFVVNDLTQEQADELANDPRVKRIHPDIIVSLPPMEVLKGKPPGTGGGGGGGTTGQETPWGITKVGGAGTPSTGVTAWIIDTGLDTDHPDLNVAAARCTSFVTKGAYSVEDGNGHGTHVGGTVGAKNNNEGVIGVAPGVELVALRCLDNRGSGSFSWSIDAFDYLAANGASGDVANYSVGPGSRYTLQTLDDAVEACGAAGISVCMAAGNSDDDCSFYSPARLNALNVYTIASMTNKTAKSSFSNYGSPVDYWEPGSGIKSTYKDGGYATLSGTSMASPHACGILACGEIEAGTGNVSGVPSGTTTAWGQRKP